MPMFWVHKYIRTKIFILTVSIRYFIQIKSIESLYNFLRKRDLDYETYHNLLIKIGLSTLQQPREFFFKDFL